MAGGNRLSSMSMANPMAKSPMASTDPPSALQNANARQPKDPLRSDGVSTWRKSVDLQTATAQTPAVR